MSSTENIMEPTVELGLAYALALEKVDLDTVVVAIQHNHLKMLVSP